MLNIELTSIEEEPKGSQKPSQGCWGRQGLLTSPGFVQNKTKECLAQQVPSVSWGQPLPKMNYIPVREDTQFRKAAPRAADSLLGTDTPTPNPLLSPLATGSQSNVSVMGDGHEHGNSLCDNMLQ